MPTSLDNMMKSKNMVLAFGGAVAAAAVWSIWGSDMFPAESDPTGKPEEWTREELRRWLEARNLYPGTASTREELLARVLANLRTPPRGAAARKEESIGEAASGEPLDELREGYCYHDLIVK